ncbi:hypothetical protein MMC20_002323 [Loxospora ochrophaea]|nr:hypothetical protein [Loxospora ochrophaea]
MASTAPEKILITGVNGFIGYATTARALAEGYHVVAAVRRQDAADSVLRGASVLPYHQSKALTFAIIPDMTVLDAFVEPAKGCSYILHIASPLGYNSGDLYRPAVGGVEALLHAAEVTSSVKRIVWTGSVFGNVPFEQLLASYPDNQAVAAGKDEDVPYLTGDSAAEGPHSLPDDAPGLQRYSAGKIAAMNALRTYAAAHANDASSHFDIVATVPGWVIGPSELPKNQKEAFDGFNTNSVLLWMFTPLYRLNAVLGVPNDEDAPLTGTQLHIDDCAEVHVRAIKVTFSGKMRSYLLCSDGKYGANYEDALDIVKKNFPDVAQKIIPDAHFGTIKTKMDATPAEKELLGRPFQTYEQMVLDTIAWYKDLPE